MLRASAPYSDQRQGRKNAPMPPTPPRPRGTGCAISRNCGGCQVGRDEQTRQELAEYFLSLLGTGDCVVPR